MIKDVTNMLFIKGNKVLLGLKKRGFGANKYNGFGGKLQKDETIEQAALREAEEESGLKPVEYQKVGIIDFGDSYKLRMHLYICTKWIGEVSESEEMRPEWFDFNNIPYDEMWKDDRYWIPLVLEGKKIIATFIFMNNDDTQGTADNEIIDYSIIEVNEIPN